MHQAGHTSLAQAISTSCMQGIRPAAESARKLTLRQTDSGAAKHHAHVRGLGHEVAPLPIPPCGSHAVHPAVERQRQTAAHDALYQTGNIPFFHAISTSHM